MNVVKILRDKTTFIIGSKKNAGKTTFLNYSAARLRKTEPIAYLTIGVDGERTDQVFGTPKPKIFARKNDILLTTDLSLNHSDASFKILNTYPYATVLGKLMLLEVLREGYVELIGPQTNLQLSAILQDIKKRKIKTILVDGAINRLTQVSSHCNSHFIYVAELRPENFNSATDSIKLIYSLCSTPKYKEASLEEKRIYRLNGAITKKKADLIPKDINAVILQDFTKVFLTYRDWQSLTKKYNLYFTEKFKLSAFIVNLYHINANNFKKALNSKEIMEKVIFNPYAE